MESLQKRAVRRLFKAGLHVIPLMPDQSFLSIFEGKIKGVPSPDGREFLRYLLLSGKRVDCIAADQESGYQPVR